MAIQKFLVEEVKELIYDVDKLEEWKQKCEELGLDKQLGLTEKEASPIPFEHMKEIDDRVYKTLCPVITRYKEYNKTTIPLEVLSLIALAEKEQYFEHIEIWYDDKAPDPLVVGLKKKGLYNYDKFLIAKWGDVILPFAKLKVLAIQRFKESNKIALNKRLRETQSKIANMDSLVIEYFDGQINEYEVRAF